MSLRTITLPTILAAALAAPGLEGVQAPCPPAETGCVSPGETAQPDAITQTISEDLRIEKVFPKLELASTGTAGTWALRGAGPTFQLFRTDESTALFTAWEAPGPVPSLIVGRRAGFRDSLGIGTDTPTSPLHVRVFSSAISPLVLIESQHTNVIGQNLLRLSNNGPATFRFENQAAIAAGEPGGIWAFGARALGNQFFISASGAPGLNLTMDPNGNMTIAGALTQMSDRASKHEIVPVDGGELLRRVVALPVSSWSYKGDQARHVGPMAQDFAQAFGLGSDDKHVAPSDVAGVGLAALQALARQLDETNARLAALERALSEKQAEIAALRQGSSGEALERR